LVPGTANSVYFDFHLVNGLAADGRFRVEVLLASRRSIEPWIRTLKANGYAVCSVTAENGWDGNNLLPSEQAQPLFRPTVHSVTALALVALILTAGWNIPLWNHNAATTSLESQAAAVMPDAIAAESLMVTLRQRIKTFEDLLAERQSSRPLADILLELTNLHSDGSWVRSLKIAGREIAIQGETKDIATLMSRLEKSPMFEGVEVLGPAVKIRGSFYETYHIRIRLAANPGR
jgi:hypothetical protein